MGKDKWLKKCLKCHLVGTVEGKFPFSNLLWLKQKGALSPLKLDLLSREPQKKMTELQTQESD